MLCCRDLIYSTTQQEIIDAVNLLIKSPWLSYNMNYTGKKELILIAVFSKKDMSDCPL